MRRLQYGFTALAAFLFLSLLLCSPVSAQLGKSFEDLKETELFTKYQLEPVDASVDQLEMMRDLSVFRPKEGEHRDQISVILQIDSTQQIRSINLTISRTLINRKATAKYAADFTATFLRSVVPEEDLPNFNDLINQIEWPRNGIYPPEAERPQLPDYPTSDYITYLGKNKVFVKSYAHTALHVENLSTPEAEMFSISLMPL